MFFLLFFFLTSTKLRLFWSLQPTVNILLCFACTITILDTTKSFSNGAILAHIHSNMVQLKWLPRNWSNQGNSKYGPVIMKYTLSNSKIPLLPKFERFLRTKSIRVKDIQNIFQKTYVAYSFAQLSLFVTPPYKQWSLLLPLLSVPLINKSKEQHLLSLIKANMPIIKRRVLGGFCFVAALTLAMNYDGKPFHWNYWPSQLEVHMWCVEQFGTICII